MTVLGMGTYRSRDAAASVSVAASAGCPLIDTAPVYGGGAHQAVIAPVLRTHPRIRVSSKVGHMTGGQARAAVARGALHGHDARLRHSIAPDYVRHQIAMSRIELQRRVLDVVYLHNPEHHHQERGRLRHRLRHAFTALEEAHAAGVIRGYGVATWTGFDSGAFTVDGLTRLAREAAGGHETGLAAIQLPVSMVKAAPVRQSLRGTGPVHQARGAGLEVWASAPFHGGELPPLINRKLADAVHPGSSGVEAALRFTASTPGLTGVLISTSSAAHWRQAAAAIRTSVPPRRLKDICELLQPSR
ncbi:aldo/keto reductase [Allonocardiopsis opalescens]|uniref:Aryl-alcohol dehydrogenase-like predicted oxidoreductase n=1 Tax=Allonocardiopsis opalescens TaxID=1144618 RepID=A0A2T0QCE7_9ACTN|nr:aldo/keto reductase [Allonocardiopsis opalescens]PRY01585.1 aryl-alcohol dehydrogenase-like predicted oxidoreductase [Allonocardiopsis opalescens]